MELSIQQSTSPGAFYLFPMLAPELRNMIIFVAIQPESRYLGPFRRSYWPDDVLAAKEFKDQHVWANKKCRAKSKNHLAWVNKEFRAAFLSVYTKLFIMTPANLSEKRERFRDYPLYAMLPYQTLCLHSRDFQMWRDWLNSGKLHNSPSSGPWLHLLTPEAHNRIAHMTFEITESKGSDGGGYLKELDALFRFMEDVVKFPNLETLWLCAVGKTQFVRKFNRVREFNWNSEVKVRAVKDLYELYHADPTKRTEYIMKPMFSREALALARQSLGGLAPSTSISSRSTPSISIPQSPTS